MVVDYVEKIMALPNAPQQLDALYAAIQNEKNI